MGKNVCSWTTIFKDLEDGSGNIVGALVICNLAHTVTVFQDSCPIVLGGCFGLTKFDVDLVS